MRKDNISYEEKLKRLQVLSGIKPINENRQGTQSTIVDTIKINNTTYGIVKESGFYYIKSTTSDIINESTLNYIGGLGNKKEFKYTSYSDALKNLNMMKINLQESFTHVEEDIDVDTNPEADAGQEMGAPDQVDEQLEKDIDPAAGGGQPMPQGPAPEMPPAPMPEPAPAPAPAPSPEMPPAPAPAEPQGQPTPDQDAEFAEPNGTNDQVDHFVGKLTGELRQQTEMLDSDRLKGIINSILAAIDLQKIDPDSRFQIGKRIKDGKNAQEDGGEEKNDVGGEPDALPTPAPEPSSEPAPEEEPMAEQQFNEMDDLKINEFFHNNRKEVIMEGSKLKVKNFVVEAKGNQVILSKGDKSHTYIVSDKTVGKLEALYEHKLNKVINEQIADYFKKNI